MSINILNNSIKNLDELVVDEVNKQLKIKPYTKYFINAETKDELAQFNSTKIEAVKKHKLSTKDDIIYEVVFDNEQMTAYNKLAGDVFVSVVYIIRDNIDMNYLVKSCINTVLETHSDKFDNACAYYSSCFFPYNNYVTAVKVKPTESLLVKKVNEYLQTISFKVEFIKPAWCKFDGFYFTDQPEDKLTFYFTDVEKIKLNPTFKDFKYDVTFNKQQKIQYNAMKKYAFENAYNIQKSNFCLDDVIAYFDFAYLDSASKKLQLNNKG